MDETRMEITITFGIWGNGQFCIAVTEETIEGKFDILWIHESKWIVSRNSNIIDRIANEASLRRRRITVVCKCLVYNPDLTDWRYGYDPNLINVIFNDANECRISTSGYNTKFAVLKERGPFCWYCRKTKATTIDHLIPISKGGSLYVDNLVPACHECNGIKGAENPRIWLGEEKFNEFKKNLSEGPETFRDPYCNDPEDKELFDIIEAKFSRLPDVKIVPGVMAKAIMRFQHAALITHPFIMKALTKDQAINIGMSHPLEKVSVNLGTVQIGREIPDLARRA